MDHFIEPPRKRRPILNEEGGLLEAPHNSLNKEAQKDCPEYTYKFLTEDDLDD